MEVELRFTQEPLELDDFGLVVVIGGCCSRVDLDFLAGRSRVSLQSFFSLSLDWGWLGGARGKGNFRGRAGDGRLLRLGGWLRVVWVSFAFQCQAFDLFSSSVSAKIWPAMM